MTLGQPPATTFTAKALEFEFNVNRLHKTD